ncbi:MAG TPA: hypothetical protein VFM36_06955 [Thermoanaerobaculia bacterium]|nr:hypothetical protein [Thermoanaerobaculia bacterium]
MTDTEHQKIHIERAIERARDGVSERIDELDQKLRQSFDLGSVASQHAPKIVGAGAAVGFLVGFGFPSIFRKALKIGLPVALVGLAVMKARRASDESVLLP